MHVKDLGFEREALDVESMFIPRVVQRLKTGFDCDEDTNWRKTCDEKNSSIKLRVTQYEEISPSTFTAVRDVPGLVVTVVD